MLLLFTLNYEAGWDWGTPTYDCFWTLKGTARHLFFNGFHPVVPWLGFLFVGMVLGRPDVTDAHVRVLCRGSRLRLGLATPIPPWPTGMGHASADQPEVSLWLRAGRR